MKPRAKSKDAETLDEIRRQVNRDMRFLARIRIDAAKAGRDYSHALYAESFLREVRRILRARLSGGS